jgi:hypothetical protein
VPSVFACPTCNARLKVPSKYYGRWVTCPRCGAGFAALKNEPSTSDSASDVQEYQPPRRGRLLIIALLLTASVFLPLIVALIFHARGTRQPRRGPEAVAAQPAPSHRPDTPASGDSDGTLPIVAEPPFPVQVPGPGTRPQDGLSHRVPGQAFPKQLRVQPSAETPVRTSVFSSAIVLGSCGTLLAGVIVVIVFLAMWAGSRGTVCPHCGKWWAKTVVKTEILSAKKSYGLVTRRSFSSSFGSYSGTSQHSGSTHSTWHSGNTSSYGSTRWKERVPVTRTEYQLHCQCKYCAGEWTEEKVHEEEDFDIERP